MSSYSMPGGRHAGMDDFRGKQEPQVEPVDALSRFVLDRIREAETEPVVDQVPELHDAQPMAHRYAGYVRKDCVVFRRVVAEHLAQVWRHRDCLEQLESGGPVEDDPPFAHGAECGLRLAVLAIASRWSDHPEFRAEWRLA